MIGGISERPSPALSWHSGAEEMDPSMYVFPPPALSLQQSKLATYLNLNSSMPTSSIRSSEHELEIHSSIETRRKSDEEFIPAGYFIANDVLHESPPKTPTNEIFSTDKCLSSSNALQVHQENVGGTTYFFSTNNESASNGGPNMQIPHIMHSNLYTGGSKNVPPTEVRIKSGLTSSFQLRESIRSEIIIKNQIAYSQPDLSEFAQLPSAVEQYVDLLPLENSECEEGVVPASTYRVSHRETGQLFIMRRLHDFNFAFTKLPLIIEKWKKINHPNFVQLREVFSTKVFGDQSLMFIYDYHPSSITLFDKYMLVNRVGHENVDPFSSDPDTPRPYTHQKNTILRATHGGVFMPENTIWNIIVQITAGLRAIHNAGLSCWYLDPSKIIVSGSTVRIAWGGVNEIIKVASCGSTGLQMTAEEAQQEDLSALGRIVLGLVCQSNLPLDPRVTNIYIQTVTRDCSTDLKNLVMYLLASSKSKSLVDLMPMIGARFYSFTETLQRQVDALEDQLSLEMDNSRLYRLLVAVNTVVDRPELNMDQSWAETGDRYILKLFRDYMFHSVTPEGRPWLDNAHIIYCLNQLDCGTNNKIQLVSRNEQSVLIVTYNELNQCLERAFLEVIEAASTP